MSSTAEAQAPSKRRHYPVTVWLLVAMQAALMFTTMILYPPFQQPDEVAHIDYVNAYRHGQWWDGPGERHYQSGYLVAFDEVPQTQFRTHVGGTTPVPRSDRKSFDELGTAPSDSPFPNQMTQHPPLYYAVAAGFTYLIPNFTHQRYDIQLFWLRLLSLILLLPVPLLIYSSARHIGGSHGVGVLAALVPMSMPQYLRTGASVNNDSMLVLTCVVLSALLVRVAWGDLSRRTSVFVGVAWGAALLSKAFALALIPAIILVYLVGASGPLRERIRAGLPGMIAAGAIGSVIGAWWYVRNVIVYHKVVPEGFGNLPDDIRQLGFGRDRPGGTDWNYFPNFFRLLGQRIWGSLGLLDTPSLPRPALWLLSIVLVVLLVAAIVLGVPRYRAAVQRIGFESWTSWRAFSLVLPTLLVIGTMYLGKRSVYLHGRQLSGIQARYLAALILGIALCVAVVLYRVAGRQGRWLPLAGLLATLAFLAISARYLLVVEMSDGVGGEVQQLKDGLRFVVDWGPFPATVTAVLLALVGVVICATVVAVARDVKSEVAARPR